MFRQADKRTIRRSSRLVLGGVVAATMLCCVAVTPVQAAPKPPPNPTNSQLQGAASQKAALAQQVGQLSAQIAQAQSRLQSLQAQAELAEQKYAYAMQLLTEATAKAAAAQAAVASAQKTIENARANLTSYVRSSYMSPTVGSSTIDLLTASDPTALLQGGDYQNYISNHHLDALGTLDRATVAKSNAEAQAQSAKVLQTQRTNAANTARQAAEQAYEAEQSEAAQLQSSQAAATKQLAAAQLKLATLNNQRATYVAFQRQQAAIAAAKARAEALARQRAAAAEAAAQAALAAQRQQQQQQQDNNSSSGSSGGGGGSQAVSSGWSAPAGPSGGGWTAAKGQAAASKALSQLGVRYAWAGGNYSGPTYGVNSPGTDGWNDSQVYGFDCSGLALFAWYPALSMSHLASNQYFEAGSYHPSSGDFRPGDLLFWSDGGADAIHHVAIYIGGGNVVQAPNSGDVVKVTPWDQVSYGYFGATRPLT